jgi:hypothetical protein
VNSYASRSILFGEHAKNDSADCIVRIDQLPAVSASSAPLLEAE